MAITVKKYLTICLFVVTTKQHSAVCPYSIAIKFANLCQIAYVAFHESLYFPGMGFDESLVRDLMRRKIEQHGVGYETASSLLDAVLEAQRWGFKDDRQKCLWKEFKTVTLAPRLSCLLCDRTFVSAVHCC